MGLVPAMKSNGPHQFTKYWIGIQMVWMTFHHTKSIVFADRIASECNIKCQIGGYMFIISEKFTWL